MKRILSLILVIAIVISLSFCFVGVSFAASSSELLYDGSAKSQWDDWFSSNQIFDITGSDSAVFWQMMDNGRMGISMGSVSQADMVLYLARWNDVFRAGLKSIYSLWFSVTLIDNCFFEVELAYDSDLGVYRLREVNQGIYIVNSSGHFPYYRPASEEETKDPVKAVPYVWMTTDQVDWYGSFDLRSFSALTALSKMYAGSVLAQRGEFYHISNNVAGMTVWLCTPEGSPLSAVADLASTGVGTQKDYITPSGDITSDKLLDIEDNTLVAPDGTVQYIDNVTYDSSTKTYHVDAHSEYTYNSTTNNYEYNTYNYTYQYHIDHTSVTYIGTTSEYDKTYEYYYQLPDGRSSADLSAADLEQLSLVFHDVVNYARSADDLSLRRLYHFDGNTDDSSYWSYHLGHSMKGNFEWIAGASLTYMDEGAFGGSLYLDETPHMFVISPPGNDLRGDWTLQFRYYQSATTTPDIDSYISVGDNMMFYWSGTEYRDAKGQLLCPTSVGTWNEICLMRREDTLYYYINGVCYGDVPCGYFRPDFAFFFGSGQQTYKKIDELRFVTGAIYGGRDPYLGYTPSSVPFDTNLSLVLPDSDIPVADEVLVFEPSTDNLLIDTGMAEWRGMGLREKLIKYESIGAVTSPLVGTYDPTRTNLGYSANGHKLYTGTAKPTSAALGTVTGRNLQDGIFIPFLSCVQGSNNDTIYSSPLSGGTQYCFSVVLSDGSSSSLVFELTTPLLGGVSGFTGMNVLSISNNSAVTLEYETLYQGNPMFVTEGIGVLILPVEGMTPEILHMELVEGTEPKWSVSFDYAVYSSGQLEDSPVLAVRSNLNVRTYQFGGVRSSLPSKGDVWAMVEGGRITSLQQYSGYAWQEVDGRIWTGSRWVPLTSYDVFTMQDFWDTVGVTPEYEYIYTESGFWSWFQRHWNEFTDGVASRHEELIEAIEGVSGGSVSIDIDVLPGDSSTDADTDGWTFFDLLGSIKDGLWGFSKGLVSSSFDGIGGLVKEFTGVGSFFDFYDPDSSDGIFGKDKEVDSVWD